MEIGWKMAGSAAGAPTRPSSVMAENLRFRRRVCDTLFLKTKAGESCFRELSSGVRITIVGDGRPLSVMVDTGAESAAIGDPA